MLFSLYISDLSRILNKLQVHYILYADDLEIYVHIPSDQHHKGLAIITKATQAVQNWALSAGLKLNASKSQAIFFGPPGAVRTINSNEQLAITLTSGEVIKFTETATSVILDSNLNWGPHVRSIIKKCNQVMYGLRFYRKYTTQELRKSLAQALIFPHLDYCSVVYMDAPFEFRSRLQVMQNSCVRYIFGVRRDSRITPYRTQLGWMKIDTRRSYFTALILFKALRIGEPSYLADFFTKNQPRGPTRRHVQELSVPFRRTDTGIGSFQVQGAHLWNALPSNLRNLPSYKSFKKAVWNYFMDLD